MKFFTLAWLWMIPAFACAELAEPIRLVDEDLPHAAPVVADIDGDGRRDLVVGLYRDDPYTGARFRWFRNTQSNVAPKYGRGVWLQAGGQVARVDEFCHTGAGPQLVDFDGDGLLDLVSGERDGRLRFFARRPDGSYQPPTVIAYASASDHGQFSYNSRLFLFDWDRDGDQDILATRMQQIWLIPNVGSPGAPQFGEPVDFLVRSPAQPPLAACVVADWDDDGQADLMVGHWDGSVVWYPKASQSGDPPALVPESFGKPIQLVGPGLPRVFEPEGAQDNQRPSRPAGHIRLSVVDYDDDGDLDLLVGDAWVKEATYRLEAPSPEQLDRIGRAYERERELRTQLDSLRDETETDPAEVALKRRLQIDALRSQCGAAWKERQGGGTYDRHGSVWLFERR